HDVAPAAAKLAFADDPGLGGPASLQEGFRCRVMDDTAISRKHATAFHGMDFSKGIDPVLQRHAHYSWPDDSSIGHPALVFLSHELFRKPAPTFRDHAWDCVAFLARSKRMLWRAWGGTGFCPKAGIDQRRHAGGKRSSTRPREPNDNLPRCIIQILRTAR